MSNTLFLFCDPSVFSSTTRSLQIYSFEHGAEELSRRLALLDISYTVFVFETVYHSLFHRNSNIVCAVGLRAGRKHFIRTKKEQLNPKLLLCLVLVHRDLLLHPTFPSISYPLKHEKRYRPTTFFASVKFNQLH